MTPSNSNTWLITGGCGFIGSNLIRLILRERSEVRVVNVDALTYAGNTANLADLSADQAARHELIKADITDVPVMRAIFERTKPSVVFHLAAESHVDRSLTDAAPFIRTNVQGTQTMLECALASTVARFVHVSTDEVYGSLGPKGAFTESSPLAPNSPYAASKAASDLLVRAAHHSFGLDTVTTRCSNNYGPYQFPEKLIPLMIKNAINDESLPVYGDGLNVRDWIHVEDHCRALLAVAERGRAGEVYNIGSRNEWPNLKIVRELLQILRKSDSLIRYVQDRAGHDRRYAIDPHKIETECGWTSQIPFNEGLRSTVKWYQDNRPWWEAILSGEYRRFYDQYYGDRLKQSNKAQDKKS